MQILEYNKIWQVLPMFSHAGELTGVSTDVALLQNYEKVISPIKGVDFAITVYGESMVLEYPSGSRLLIKCINPSISIDWGKVLLDTSNGVNVKEVHSCEKKRLSNVLFYKSGPKIY